MFVTWDLCYALIDLIMYELFIQQHLPLGCGVRVWILTQGWSPNFLKSRSRSPSKKEDCFWIFMHFFAVLYNFCATGLDIYW